MNLISNFKENSLTKGQMKNTQGGVVGSCQYIAVSTDGEVVHHSGLTRAEAEGSSNSYSGSPDTSWTRWCCDSCSTTSWATQA